MVKQNFAYLTVSYILSYTTLIAVSINGGLCGFLRKALSSLKYSTKSRILNFFPTITPFEKVNDLENPRFSETIL